MPPWKWPKRPLLLVLGDMGGGLSQLLTDLEALVTPELEAAGIELVDLSYQKEQAGWTLRFFLDKAGGITLSDCETWSRRIGDILDGTELLAHAYNLEVSSPGIDRPLRKLKDFQRFVGERVTVRTYGPINGQKNFHGILAGADETVVRVRLEGDREVALPREQIAKSKLDPIIDF